MLVNTTDPTGSGYYSAAVKMNSTSAIQLRSCDEFPLLCTLQTTMSFYGMWILVSLGILTNILVVMTLGKSRKMRRNSAGFLMIILATTDCVFLLTELMGLLDIYVLEERIDKPWCQILYYIKTTSRNMSNMATLLIIINRYALVCHLFTHTEVTSRRAAALQTATVLIFCLVGSCWEFFVYSPKHRGCQLRRDYPTGRIIYLVGDNVFTNLLCNIVPIVVIIVLTVLVLRALRAYKEHLGQDSVAQQTRQRKQGERQVTKALMAVNVAFLTLHIPYLIVYTVYSLDGQLVDFAFRQFEALDVARQVTKLMDTLNFTINLFLYVSYSAHFRQAFLSLLLCRPAPGQDSDVSKKSVSGCSQSVATEVQQVDSRI